MKKNVKSIIWRVIGYLIYAGLVIFITFQISSKAMASRRAKYQDKYINKLYVESKSDDAATSQAYRERYLAEALGLQNGFIDLKPIYETAIVTPEIKDSKGTSFGTLDFEIKVYRAGFIGKKGKYTSGYVLYFSKFDHVKGEQRVDLTYRTAQKDTIFEGEDIPGIFTKGFSQEVFEKHYFKLTLEFNEEKFPILLNKEKEKGRVSSSLIIPSRPRFLTEEILKAEAGIADVEAIKISYLPYTVVEELKAAKKSLLDAEEDKYITAARIVRTGIGNNQPAIYFQEGLEAIGHENYEFKKAEVDNVEKFVKTKGTEEIPALPYAGHAVGDKADVKIIRVNLSKCLGEFNKTPAIIIFVVLLLVVLATYFLFGHKHVMAKVRAKKAQKQAEVEDPGFKVEDYVQDVEAEDVTEAKPEEETKE